jgi:hypothetical protein
MSAHERVDRIAGVTPLPGEAALGKTSLRRRLTNRQCLRAILLNATVQKALAWTTKITAVAPMTAGGVNGSLASDVLT